MSFVFTGVRHLKTGDEIIPAVRYEEKDEYVKEYHHEMGAAMSDDNSLGLGIKVFDAGTLQDVLVDNWVRKIESAEEV